MSILKTIEKHKLIAIIRSSSASDAKEMIEAAIKGGFKVFEVSLQTPKALQLIRHYNKRKELCFGAGMVKDGEDAQKAIIAGAQFLSTPYTSSDVVAVAQNNNAFVIQGALTPTEISDAYKIGANLVMVYPVSSSGGPAYLRSLRRAFPSMPFMSCGGVGLENVSEYLKDSLAVGVRQSLFPENLVRKDDWKQIAERARLFHQKLKIEKKSKKS
jgi:2-dehydro-3-deoxyphosphogluconate aldolase/(4S)-4-hydroxy-2-oxoglutarate aldolase